MVNINGKVKYGNDDIVDCEFRRVVASSGGNSHDAFIINKENKYLILSSDSNYYSECVVN